MNLLCLLGFHKWLPWSKPYQPTELSPLQQFRECQRCGKEQSRYLGGMR